MHLLVFCFCFCFQEPRPLSQADLMRVIATSTKTKVAANEYSRLNSQSVSGWSPLGDSDNYQVQAAINEITKMVVSRFLNIQPDQQDE